MKQGNDSISVYFTKLKLLWDELNSLEPLPPCNCGLAKELAEISNRSKIMQFLICLTEDQARNQILLLDPLPSINKTYSIILKVETQKQVVNSCLDRIEYVAL